MHGVQIKHAVNEVIGVPILRRCRGQEVAQRGQHSDPPYLVTCSERSRHHCGPQAPWRACHAHHAPRG